MKESEADRIRNSVREKLIQPAVDCGERACFDLEAAMKAATDVSTNRANIQGAIEGWIDRGLTVRWFGERHWRQKTVVYVVDVDE